jgi:hypothetical protein
MVLATKVIPVKKIIADKTKLIAKTLADFSSVLLLSTLMASTIMADNENNIDNKKQESPAKSQFARLDSLKNFSARDRIISIDPELSVVRCLR